MNQKLKIGLVIAAIELASATGFIILGLTSRPTLEIQNSSWGNTTMESAFPDQNGFGSVTVHYECTIVNHGDEAATSVDLVLMLYDSTHEIGRDTLQVGDIPAHGSIQVSHDVGHLIRYVVRVDANLTWNP